MLRYEEFDKISDGRKYTADDMVAAGTKGCQGCSKCCESDMGKTIVLTPYDIYNLTLALDMTFDEMLTEFLIELSMIDGVVLPHLKMDEGCKLLKDGRCQIHKYRPGICRLFPLGRIYEDKSFSYFLQVNECKVKDRTDVKVRDWIDIPDLEQNTSFINKWHRFLGFEKKKVASIREMSENLAKRVMEMSDPELETFVEVTKDQNLYDTFVDSEKNPKDIIDEYRKSKAELIRQQAETSVKGVMKTVLAYLYLDKYNVTLSFYDQFDERLKKCIAELRRFN